MLQVTDDLSGFTTRASFRQAPIEPGKITVEGDLARFNAGSTGWPLLAARAQALTRCGELPAPRAAGLCAYRRRHGPAAPMVIAQADWFWWPLPGYRARRRPGDISRPRRCQLCKDTLLPRLGPHSTATLRTGGAAFGFGPGRPGAGASGRHGAWPVAVSGCESTPVTRTSSQHARLPPSEERSPSAADLAS